MTYTFQDFKEFIEKTMSSLYKLHEVFKGHMEYLKIAHRHSQKCKHFCLAPRARTRSYSLRSQILVQIRMSPIIKIRPSEDDLIFMAAPHGRVKNF